MIAILTDKPNVGKEIARILGAHTREDGYMSGNGYMVTWTFGNMLSLAMPKDYGMDRPERGDFPINPAPFRLMVKHIRTDTGWIPDINAVLQLKVIEKVFDACESIIAATDASREGEMVFRYLYRYLECRKPYRRLWISSLTDEAVLEGMGSLRPGSLYDRMFLAADSRNKADWVLGLNASYALCQATGTGNNSLGRVQTPVLAAISSRYRERENHIATDTFPVFISLCKNNTLLKMRCTEEFTDREAAARLYSDCKLAGHARVTAVSRQIREIEPPALYNLTELQKDANNYYGMTAGKSLEIAQRLYEKKLISYPRTAGRFLPRDVYDKLPRIMAKNPEQEGIPTVCQKHGDQHIRPAGQGCRRRTGGGTPRHHHYRYISGRIKPGGDAAVHDDYRTDAGSLHARMQGGIHHRGCRMCRTKFPVSCMPHH